MDFDLHTGLTPEEVEAMKITDVDLMKRAWRNEKAAPEILEYEEELEDNIADMSTETTQVLELQMYTMDVNRARFLARSYLKARLAKIDRDALFIFSNNDAFGKLSQAEQEYLKKNLDLIEKHMKQSVLSRMPEGYDSLLQQSDTSDTHDMIPEPNLDTYVFCRTKAPMESFQLDDTGDETVDWQADELYIFRYRPIKELLQAHRLELV
eukprot:jgi/Mesen1/7242/ME000373S06304